MTTLIEESIEVLERVGCQFDFCDGPTLRPVAMRTCFVCDLLARLRVSVGRAPRRDDELTVRQAGQARWDDYQKTVAGATARRYADQ